MILSAFGDEIEPGLQGQIQFLKEQDIHYMDLRNTEARNVLDLTDPEVERIREMLYAAGFRLSAIASPLGKEPLVADIEVPLTRVRRALAIGRRLEARYVRIFSFFPPEGGPDGAAVEQLVIRHLC